MRSVSTPVTVALLAISIGIPTAAIAEDEEPVPAANAYFTGTLRLGAASDEGDVVEVDGGYDVRGLRLDLPLETDDPRTTGLLSIRANGVSRWDGYGGDIESRTYRLVNAGGAWAGSGTSVRADGSGDTAAPMTVETALLTGEGDYDGLTAYLHMETDWDASVFESQVRGLILAADPPPMPDSVAPADE